MTNLPDDLLDPAEGRLMRRVRSLTEPAVIAIDPMAIASAATVAGRRRSLADRIFGTGGRGAVGAVGRLALVGTGAVIAAVTLGSLFGGGGRSVPPAQTAASSVAPEDVCASTDLSGRIVRWEGAAGNRIATVELSNTTTSDCRLTQYQLSLVDGGGRGQALIQGQELNPGVVLRSGATVHTLVDVSNYCLAYVPIEPVTILLDDPTEHGDVVLAPAIGGLSGVPPCNGAPGSRGSIGQQAWEPGRSGS